MRAGGGATCARANLTVCGGALPTTSAGPTAAASGSSPHDASGSRGRSATRRRGARCPAHTTPVRSYDTWTIPNPNRRCPYELGCSHPLARQPRGGGRARGARAPSVRPLRERKPPWLKVPAPGGARYRALTQLIREEGLHTVCQEAACPNVGECWERGTATFMILGDTCTRRCGFCNVKTGRPTWHDPLEPARVARSIARMGLRHAVVTSVDRDDLPDKGASAFVGVIRQVRRQAPGCLIEVLTPDFQGHEMPLARVLAERPDVFNHNVEVVPRLYPLARRGSSFARSCRVLALAKELRGGRGHHEVGADGRPRRDSRRARGGLRARCASTACRCSPSASTCAPPSGTSRSCATGTPTSSPRWSAPRTSSASLTSPPGRWCAPPTTPTSTCRSGRGAQDRWPRAARRGRRGARHGAGVKTGPQTGVGRSGLGPVPAGSLRRSLLFTTPTRTVTRVLVLLVAALFIVGFAYLTLSAIAAHGFTLDGAISMFVVVLMGVGIFGALLTPPRQ